ncbi:right-handed parallel beta-helix repeat-containing protein [Candidatus Uabimicrobium sp. HlEnr_7]|uniref:right-handed parallel beta-helix repeat-containing protein n=1 Tax=Candidatus Uabimicrobium helgolandensis TaxID=3095367 RepID=UPI003556F285
MSNRIPMPVTTASFKLFFSTVIFIALTNVAYFTWYSPSKDIPDEAKGKTIIVVAAEDNLNHKIKNAPENSILLITPSKREENIVMENKSGITLKAEGQVFVWANKGTAITIKGCNNCEIENINFSGQDETAPLFLISHSAKIIFRSNKIKSTATSFDIQAKSSDIYIENNDIKTKKSAIYVETGKNIYIKNNKMLSGSEQHDIIHFKDVEQFLFEKNIISGSKGIVLRHAYAKQKSAIFRNEIKTDLQALEMYNCRDILLTANIIESYKKDAVFFKDCSSIKFGRSQVVKNKVKTENGCCLALINGQKIEVFYNSFTNSSRQRSAIEVESGKTVFLRGNDITGKAIVEEGKGVIVESQGGGIYIKDSENTICKENTIKHSEKGIFVDICPSVIIDGNKIHGNQGRGIEAESSTIEVSNNSVKHNSVGLWINQSKGFISQNTIANNKGYGVYLDDSSPKITKNHVVNNEEDGLYCNNKSTPSEIIGNRFIRNKGFGIKFEKKVKYGDNFFEGNQKGNSN